MRPLATTSSIACMCHLLLALAAAQEAVIVRTEINPANGHLYHLLRSGPDGCNQTNRVDCGLSWTEGETAARQLGGHLVAINDAEEQRWLLDAFPLDGVRDGYIWIGLNDVVNEGEFVWSNGDPLVYENWFGEEPNDFDGGEDYVHIYNFENGNFQWNDNKDIERIDGFQFSAVAEVVPVPEPSAGALLLLGFGVLASRLNTFVFHPESESPPPLPERCRDRAL